jgi:DNA polymerase-3 subunit epsilon
MSANFAVIDCETTGFGNADRIIEFAIVLLDSETLETVDEFDTLINPLRDVGKTDIHGITATMLSAAPTMNEIIGRIAEKIDNTVLVAHSLPFDSRMLTNECDRLSVQFNAGIGVCTLKLTGEKLISAATRRNIPLIAQHRALADARATAEIFRMEYKHTQVTKPARLIAADFSSTARTLRRDASDFSSVTPLNRLLSRACFPSSDDACIDYFDALDWVLDDATVSAQEQLFLDAVISDLNLSMTQVHEMHEAYLRSIIVAAKRDGVITEFETSLISQIASALGLADFEIPVITTLPIMGSLRKGFRICFTGSGQDANGGLLGRADLEILAASFGMQPVNGVTRSKCDLLVAADPSSSSAKAKKAREYEIPIISVTEFLTLCK